MKENLRSSVQAQREPLSRDRVLVTGMRLADAEGLAAVTMRRVASELGVEAILAEIGTAIGATTNDGQEWDAALRRRCLTAREVMLRHRWAPALIGSRTAIPVPLYAYYEEILTTLVGGGFSYHLAHRAIHALGSMVLGFTQELFSPAAGGEAPSDEDTEAAMAEMAAALPHLTAMVTAELHDHQDDPLGWCDSQAEFEFTLDLLLEGLARRT